MLWLHMGMPKTGTTALQGYVRQNKAPLADAGLHYIEAGRRRLEGGGRPAISHNIIAFHINQTNKSMDPFRALMAAEYDVHSDKTCLVSSEMFYSCDLDRLAQVFAEIPSRALRITYYCRRYSDFFEADYKQRAKNGRLDASASEYVRDRLAKIKADPGVLTFSAKLAQIRQAFPGVLVMPMLYDRAQMVQGHIVDDFMSRIGLPLPEVEAGDRPSNQSQSRAASEAFGIVSRSMGRKESRQLRRRVVDDPVMVRRYDVLEPDERAWLDEYLTKEDIAFKQEFFPDRPNLFEPVALSEEDQRFRRDTPKEYDALRRASEIVFRMALED
ncbi:hypothetical protein RUE5091_01188 [Ruegeria denitrificans]|uniref:Sulfotransferase family protein n=1 Tax=Ruegeria denitrificans TaxID=1715692 RepID=A0A0P1I635_9RHOB|nr:hypothetical protein [Ruegeria denitrificans]CUJ92168.1 hypothetical protein RUE5091_01188 [Ruegeria denitrificans]